MAISEGAPASALRQNEAPRTENVFMRHRFPVLATMCFFLVRMLQPATGALAHESPADVRDASASPQLWCMLRTNSTIARLFSKQMSHAAQSLIPCLSWFEQENGRCGIVLEDGLTLPSGWPSELVSSMGCAVRTSAPPADARAFAPPRPASGVHGARVHWLSSPEHAVAVAKRVVDVAVECPPHGRSPRIAFVQRESNRRILNWAALERELHRVFPAAHIDRARFGSQTPLHDQAKFFACHEIIIGAHGTAMTNALFIRPNTIVMQLYPRNYYPHEYYEPLIEEAGGIAIDWINNSDPVSDSLKSSISRGQLRASDIEADAHVAAACIENAYRARQAPESLEQRPSKIDPRVVAPAFFNPRASGNRFLIDEDAGNLPGLGHGMALMNQGIKLALMLNLTYVLRTGMGFGHGVGAGFNKVLGFSSADFYFTEAQLEQLEHARGELPRKSVTWPRSRDDENMHLRSYESMARGLELDGSPVVVRLRGGRGASVDGEFFAGVAEVVRPVFWNAREPDAHSPPGPQTPVVRILVHLRRGDVSASQYPNRFQDETHFAHAISSIAQGIAATGDKRPLTVTVYTEKGANKTQLEGALECGVCTLIWRKDSDPAGAFNEIAQSHVFVGSRSGFSLVLASMAAKTTVLVVSAFWHTYRGVAAPCRVVHMESDVLLLMNASGDWSCGRGLEKTDVVLLNASHRQDLARRVTNAWPWGPMRPMPAPSPMPPGWATSGGGACMSCACAQYEAALWRQLCASFPAHPRCQLL